MCHELGAGLVHRLDERTRKLELAARLGRDGPAPGHVQQTDDVAVLDDRFPTEQMLHAFEQRTDTAAALIGDRVVALDRKHELLVLGTEAELRSGLAARLKPRDEFLARFDRRHVDLVASHTAVPTKRAATLHGGCKGGQLVSCLAMRSVGAPKITSGRGARRWKDSSSLRASSGRALAGKAAVEGVPLFCHVDQQL